jgi:nucleotide-binding universal stress UspA family protein
MKRILVATDFSEHAERALAWAGALAKRFDADLELVTSVFVVPLGAGPHAYGIPPDYLRNVREQADRHLDEIAARFSRDGVRVQCTVLHEDPSSGVCARAAETKADLVAIGTRGRGALSHVLLGSVAERTARLAKCPVLALHAGSPAPRPLRKLLVPMDYSPAALAALELARTLLEPGGELVLLHAIAPVLAAGAPELPLEDPRAEERARAEFEKLRGSLAGANAHLVVRYGIADVAVIEAATGVAADAIVMGTRGRTGIAHVLLGSVAERVLRRALTPVFVTQPHSAARLQA